MKVNATNRAVVFVELLQKRAHSVVPQLKDCLMIPIISDKPDFISLLTWKVTIVHKENKTFSKNIQQPHRGEIGLKSCIYFYLNDSKVTRGRGIGWLEAKIDWLTWMTLLWREAEEFDDSLKRAVKMWMTFTWMTPLWREARIQGLVGWKVSPLTRGDLVSNFVNIFSFLNKPFLSKRRLSATFIHISYQKACYNPLGAKPALISSSYPTFTRSKPNQN